MGMRGRGEIRQLCAIAAPKIGIITNIGSAHMECLGSQEQIALAKWELVEGLPPDGIAVLNGDDVWLRELADRKREARKIVWYGLGNDCEIRARSVSSGLERTCFEIELGDVRGNAEIRLPGTHNVYNSLAAIAAGWLLQIPLTVMVSRLTELTLPSMRMQLHSTAGDILILNDTYNANPDSTISALKVLAGVEGRRIAVLGDMFELGWFSQQGHRQVGIEAANSELAYLITVGRAASEIAAGAIAAGLAATRVRHFNSKEDAGEYLQTLLAAGDAVLVKASRGMQMEELVASLMDDQRLRSESGL